MDLGKMLAEALDATPGPNMWARENYEAADLTAAAEAFLAKVREAQGVDGEIVMGHAPDGALVPMRRPLTSKVGNEALAFYADPANWKPTGWQGDMDPAPCVRDAGEKARQTLVPQPWVGDHTGLVPFYGDVE